MRARMHGVAVLVAFGIASAAFAESPGMAELSTAEADEVSPLRARIVFETGVGTGTFIASDFSDDPLVYSALNVTPIYNLDDLPFQPNLALRQWFQWEYTQPNNVSGRRLDWGDTGISLSTNSLYVHESTGLRLGARLETTLPISRTSWNTHKITATTAALRATWTSGKFMVMGTAAATRHFYRYRNEVREGEVVFEDGLRAVHCRSGQDVCLGGRYVLAWSATGGILLAYQALPRLGIALDMAWTGGWRVAAPVDEFTSPNARTDNRTLDMTRTLLDVSYSLTENLSLSLGAATFQPLLSRDNRTWRNPFYDGNPANNFTTFYVDAVYSL